MDIERIGFFKPKTKKEKLSAIARTEVVIIDYGAGNVQSVRFALERLGFEAVLSNDAEEIRRADKVIFPGVSAAKPAMNYLKAKGLDKIIPSLKQPVLGICLGMQLLCEHSEEGNTPGLGVFKNKVKKFPAKGIVPHTGWNNFTSVNGDLFQGIDPGMDCYFVHGYYAEIDKDITAVTDYILPFSAALQKNNFYATQFHPEKSASVGLQILKNFLEL